MTRPLSWRAGRLRQPFRKVARLGLHISRSPLRQFQDLGHIRAGLLWAMGMPGGLISYIRDRQREQSAPKVDPHMSAWGPAAPLKILHSVRRLSDLAGSIKHEHLWQNTSKE